MKLSRRQIQHLFLRAGFGESPRIVDSITQSGAEELVEELFRDSETITDLDFIPDPLKGRDRGVSNFQILSMIIRSKGEMQNLNFQWLYRMALSKSILREKMTFFWHNHFSTSVPFSYLMQKQNNTLRRHALGKFPELIHAISKDPAMILYLNNQENHKDHPNENFAREVMELFTLGIGNYREKDVQEAARAFTGWKVNRKGQYEFSETDHDHGTKEFLGKSGNFNGEDIIEILLQQKVLATFIVKKIYSEFVNPVPNPSRINSLAEDFFKSGYDISALMLEIFSSDWFYDEENTGVKICSPVELIARYIRLFKLEFDQGETLLNFQQTLGQTLFFPPNVAGWKGGRGWIDSSSLVLRLSLPRIFFNDQHFSLPGKPEFEETNQKKLQQRKDGNVQPDWAELTASFRDIHPDELTEAVMNSFIQCNTTQINMEQIKSMQDNSSKEQLVRTTIATVLSLPEFQLI